MVKIIAGEMKASHRVAMNTGFLYGKMIITLVIALFSTRLILGALGEVDYGIFNLIGGVIAMLSFLNVAMTISTQRYMSFYLGAEDASKLRSVFTSSISLHLLIGLSIVIILEVAGIFLFNGFLNIPEERIATAKIIYHFMVVSTFFTINAVPYDAAINAHENFLFDAGVGILESVIKLIIAIVLVYTGSDKLVLYGLLMALLTILVRIIKGSFCISRYRECRFTTRLVIKGKLIKEMISFAGWNLFGSFCTIVRNQGIAVVLNLSFGVVINAAYAVAHQVNSQLILFSVNMLRSLNPQIIKSEGSGDRSRMLRLAMLACKVSFFLLALFAIPLIIEMEYVLNLWLKDVPEYTIIFCQLMLILSMTQLLTYGLGTAIQSVGRIKLFQSVVGTTLILNLPVAIILVSLGFEPYSILIGSIALEVVAGIMRILIARKITGLSVKQYLRDVQSRVVPVAVLAAGAGMVPRLLMETGFLRLVITVTSTTGALLLLGRYLSVNSYEYGKIKEIILPVVLGIKNKFSKLMPSGADTNKKI
ncbi:MAG: hypothetical protein K9J25_04305 [Bacteroidales bacterium]|nr:hypothetical protein [Bacteroidales bacterium]